MNGYFALRVDFLCEPRILDVYFDAAPAEPGNDYGGYFDVCMVIWNGVVLWDHGKGCLSKSDLEVIAEDVKAGIEQKNREEQFA